MNDFKWLKESVDKIESKVDILDSKLGDQNDTLNKQATVLDNHIKRTELAEENISMLRAEMKPLSKHVEYVNFIFKTIGFFATIAGLIEGTVALLRYLG